MSGNSCVDVDRCWLLKCSQDVHAQLRVVMLQRGNTGSLLRLQDIDIIMYEYA